MAHATGWGGWVLREDVPGPLLQLSLHDDARYIAVSPDGQKIATGSHGWANVKIWNAQTGAVERELESTGITNVAFSPDGKWFASFGGGMQLWAVDTWKKGRYIGGKGAFSPDGKLVAAEVENGTGVIRLMNTEWRVRNMRGSKIHIKTVLMTLVSPPTEQS